MTALSEYKLWLCIPVGQQRSATSPSRPENTPSRCIGLSLRRRRHKDGARPFDSIHRPYYWRPQDDVGHHIYLAIWIVAWGEIRISWSLVWNQLRWLLFRKYIYCSHHTFPKHTPDFNRSLITNDQCWILQWEWLYCWCGRKWSSWSASFTCFTAIQRPRIMAKIARQNFSICCSKQGGVNAKLWN